jgi:hypothetical protein
MTDMMWKTASGEAEEEQEMRLLTAARLEASAYWGQVADAVSPGDFQNRWAVLEDSLANRILSLTSTRERTASLLYTIKGEWGKDWSRIAKARRADEQHRAKLRAEVVAELQAQAEPMVLATPTSGWNIEGSRKTSAVNFERRHYNHIAEGIRTAPVDEETRELLAHHFAQHLAGTNQDFNHDRFVGASTKSASLRTDADDSSRMCLADCGSPAKFAIDGGDGRSIYACNEHVGTLSSNVAKRTGEAHVSKTATVDEAGPDSAYDPTDFLTGDDPNATGPASADETPGSGGREAKVANLYGVPMFMTARAARMLRVAEHDWGSYTVAQPDPNKPLTDGRGQTASRWTDDIKGPIKGTCKSCGGEIRCGTRGDEWYHSGGQMRCASRNDKTLQDRAGSRVAGYTEGVDCPGSNEYVEGDFKPEGGIGGNAATERVECPVCQKPTPVSPSSSGGGYLWVHLAPGKTLQDRAGSRKTAGVPFHQDADGVWVPEGRSILDTTGNPKTDHVTCGNCGRTWTDAVITGITPAPSALCPFCNATAYEASRKTSRRTAAFDYEGNGWTQEGPGWVVPGAGAWVGTQDGWIVHYTDYFPNGTRVIETTEFPDEASAIQFALSRARSRRPSRKTDCYDPIGYTYEAAFHCPACAIERFGREPGRPWVREDAVDSEGNAVMPVAPWEEIEPTESCDTCGTRLRTASRKTAYGQGSVRNSAGQEFDWSYTHDSDGTGPNTLVVYLLDPVSNEVLDAMGGVEAPSKQISDHGNVNIGKEDEEFCRRIAQDMADNYTLERYHTSAKTASFDCPTCGGAGFIQHPAREPQVGETATFPTLEGCPSCHGVSFTGGDDEDDAAWHDVNVNMDAYPSSAGIRGAQ